jgi:hypothetical protein
LSSIATFGELCCGISKGSYPCNTCLIRVYTLTHDILLLGLLSKVWRDLHSVPDCKDIKCTEWA